MDANVLSLVFRRRARGPEAPVEPPEARVLRDLLSADDVLVVPGIAYQELLSGVRTPQQFEKLRRAMGAFVLFLAKREHHLLAAEISSRCARGGVATSAPDCLIAATAAALDAALLARDATLVERVAPRCGVRVHPVPREP